MDNRQTENVNKFHVRLRQVAKDCMSGTIKHCDPEAALAQKNE